MIRLLNRVFVLVTLVESARGPRTPWQPFFACGFAAIAVIQSSARPLADRSVKGDCHVLGMGGVSLSLGTLMATPTYFGIPKNKGARAVRQAKAAFGGFFDAAVH